MDGEAQGPWQHVSDARAPTLRCQPMRPSSSLTLLAHVAAVTSPSLTSHVTSSIAAVPLHRFEVYGVAMYVALNNIFGGDRCCSKPEATP